MKRKRKIKKIRRVPTPVLKLRAEAVFSLYIRNRDGWKCTICGATKEGGAVIQNGHYVKRGRTGVTFSIVNCNALCSRCNFRDNHHHDYYERAIRAKWGDWAVNEMLTHAEEIILDKRGLYESIIKKYGRS